MRLNYWRLLTRVDESEQVVVNSSWLLAIPFALIGVAACIAGVELLRRGLRLRFRGRRVEATVVSRTPHRPLTEPINMSSPNVYRGGTVTPELRYRRADGIEMTATLGYQTRQRQRSKRFRLRYKLGEVVRVRIDPSHPEIADEDSISQTLVLPCLLLGAAVLMSLLALGIAFGGQ